MPKYLFLLLLVLIAACDTAEDRYPELGPGPHEITYKVLGEGEALVSYLSAAGSQVDTNVVLPFSHTISTSGRRPFWVSAVDQAHERALRTEVWADGKLQHFTDPGVPLSAMAVTGLRGEPRRMQFDFHGGHRNGDPTITLDTASGKKVVTVERPAEGHPYRHTEEILLEPGFTGAFTVSWPEEMHPFDEPADITNLTVTLLSDELGGERYLIVGPPKGGKAVSVPFVVP